MYTTRQTPMEHKKFLITISHLEKQSRDFSVFKVIHANGKLKAQPSGSLRRALSLQFIVFIVTSLYTCELMTF